MDIWEVTNAVLEELSRWTSERSPAATNELGSTRFSHHYPFRYYLWQQNQALFLPNASTPALAKDVLRVAYKVWAEDDAKVRCSEPVTEQPL